MKPSHSYISYLLRMWRSGEADHAVWRASLEDPMTGERQGFHSLPDLVAFLERLTNTGGDVLGKTKEVTQRRKDTEEG